MAGTWGFLWAAGYGERLGTEEIFLGVAWSDMIRALSTSKAFKPLGIWNY